MRSRRIRVAPGERETTIHVTELESGRGYTHISVTRDPKNSSGTVVLETNPGCPIPFLRTRRIRHGVIDIPEGATAGIRIDGDELLPRVEHHRHGRHHGMYHKRGEPAAHHIERGGAATTVANDDLSHSVSMWEED